MFQKHPRRHKRELLVCRCATYLILDCFYPNCIALNTLHFFILHINVAQYHSILHFGIIICNCHMICAVLLYVLCHLYLFYNHGNPVLTFLWWNFIGFIRRKKQSDHALYVLSYIPTNIHTNLQVLSHPIDVELSSIITLCFNKIMLLQSTTTQYNIKYSNQLFFMEVLIKLIIENKTHSFQSHTNFTLLYQKRLLLS